MISALSRLKAVNIMLRTIGLAPLNSLEDADFTSDISMALDILDETHAEVLAEGWGFNTETDVVLTPDLDGFITVGANVAQVDFEPAQGYVEEVVLRGTRLFDKAAKTYSFAGPSYKATVITMLEWDELPAAARRYIAVKAARRLANSGIGDPILAGFSEKDELDALRALKDFDGDTEDFSIFDNWDVARIVAKDGF